MLQISLYGMKLPNKETYNTIGLTNASWAEVHKSNPTWSSHLLKKVLSLN